MKLKRTALVSSSIIDTSTLILYKENLSLLEKLNFENDKTFSEPLLFAYFKTKNNKSFSKEVLEELMQGYFTEKEPLKINHSFGKESLAYLPELGYFNKLGQKVQECHIIKNTQIELLYRPFELLNSVFELASSDSTSNEIEMSSSLFEKFVPNIEKALKLIKENCTEHFNLIEKHCKRIILFKTNPKNTNSFATINAHGMAFLNAYQEDYDEVFFIDDIAHQTGHIIMTAILFERKKYFLIDENENIKKITQNETEYRSFYILFHALYTYYTTLLCLDACLESRYFDKRQTHEAMGRIGFYLMKYKIDLTNFEKIINYYKAVQNILSQEGLEIFKNIVERYFEMQNKYGNQVSVYNYNNQPYNFTYSNFIKLNPMN